MLRELNYNVMYINLILEAREYSCSSGAIKHKSEYFPLTGQSFNEQAMACHTLIWK